MAEKKLTTYGENLRKKLLGGGNGENDVTVTVNGEPYLLVPPKVKQRQAIMDKSVKVLFDAVSGKPSGVETDQGEMQVQAIIACCRDPETRLPVFEATDHDALLDGELVPLFDALAIAALKLVRPDVDEAKKNSKVSHGESSSSPSASSLATPSTSSSSVSPSSA